MRSGHNAVPVVPVLAAGLGLRRGWGWEVRSASFRMDCMTSMPLGIFIPGTGAASAVIDLLAGLTRPSYGELRVLGEDMTTARGRAAVRGRVGIARRQARPLPAVRIRGLVQRGARTARLPGHDRYLLAAAILDRLALTPWADVPVRAAPDAVARRARLAAAAVHQPELLLLDGLLDGLTGRELLTLADAISELSRDTCILTAGSDAGALSAACGDVLTLSDGILVSA